MGLLFTGLGDRLHCTFTFGGDRDSLSKQLSAKLAARGAIRNAPLAENETSRRQSECALSVSDWPSVSYHDVGRTGIAQCAAGTGRGRKREEETKSVGSDSVLMCADIVMYITEAPPPLPAPPPVRSSGRAPL